MDCDSRVSAESEECTHDCSTCSANCSSRQGGVQKVPTHPGNHIRKVIGVVSGKGGVGKSMVTALTASALRRAGWKVGVLDADITGPSIPRMFGISGLAGGSDEGIYPCESKNGVRVMSVNLLLEDTSAPVVWRGPVIAGVVTQFWTDVLWGDLDVLLVDMPPGTGDVPLTVFQSLPVDGIIVVTSPQDLVSMIVEKAINMAGMLDVPILGLVENMSYMLCPDCGKRLYPFGQSKLPQLAFRHNVRMLSMLPIDPAIAAAADAGQIESVVCPQIDDVLIAVNLVNNELEDEEGKEE
ncbi:MAG: P-loop NTPase [Clostridia bacterium]|nr:P-loop NTPase [Clostridia bacterium]